MIFIPVMLMRSHLRAAVFHYLLLFNIKFGENQPHSDEGNRDAVFWDNQHTCY